MPWRSPSKLSQFWLGAGLIRCLQIFQSLEFFWLVAEAEADLLTIALDVAAAEVVAEYLKNFTQLRAELQFLIHVAPVGLAEAVAATMGQLAETLHLAH
jgi:hypothetical protein